MMLVLHDAKIYESVMTVGNDFMTNTARECPEGDLCIIEHDPSSIGDKVIETKDFCRFTKATNYHKLCVLLYFTLHSVLGHGQADSGRERRSQRFMELPFVKRVM